MRAIRKAFPAGSTALLLFALAIVADIKGGLNVRQAIASVEMPTGEMTEQEQLSAFADALGPVVSVLKVTHGWFIARNVLSGLSLVCAGWGLYSRFCPTFFANPLYTSRGGRRRRR